MIKIKKFFSNPKVLLFLLTFGILLFFLLIYYPGVMTFDSNFQWNEVLTGKLTNSHPFLSTYFIYLMSFIYKSPVTTLVFQIIVVSYTFTKLFFMSKYKNNFVKYFIYLLILTFPLFAIYTITLWKDILYTLYLINACILVYEWSITKYDDGFKKKYLIPFLLALVFLYRINGMVVSVLFLLCILIVLLRNKVSYKNLIKIVMIFLVTVGSFTLIKNYYLNKLPKSSEVSTSTLNNYKIWIMGGYLKYGGITSEEYNFLNNITPVNTWENNYMACSINPTNMMNRNLEFLNSHQEEFDNIFYKMVKRNPNILVNHYLSSDALLLNPVNIDCLYTYGFSSYANLYTFNKTINPIIPKVHVLYDHYLNFVLRRIND